MFPAQAPELGNVDCECLCLLQRLNGRRPRPPLGDERQLAEAVAWPADPIVTVSPSGVMIRIANLPLEIRCSESAGSSRWKTTSWREKRRRRAIETNRRTSSSGTPSISRQRTRELSHLIVRGTRSDSPKRVLRADAAVGMEPFTGAFRSRRSPLSRPVVPCELSHELGARAQTQLAVGSPQGPSGGGRRLESVRGIGRRPCRLACGRVSTKESGSSGSTAPSSA